MAEVILHVGTHKTGTTSLQAFFRANKQALAQQGIGVPYNTITKYHAINPDRNAQFLLRAIWNLREPERERPGDREMIEAGYHALTEALDQFPRVLLTDEALWYRGATDEGYWPAVKRYLDQAGAEDVRIIVYFRRQDELVSSLWNQYVKERRYESHTLAQWAARTKTKQVLDYDQGLRYLERSFGKDHISVRLFDRNGFVGGDIFHDFCDAARIEYAEQFVVPEAKANPSLDRRHVLIKRIINESPSYAESANIFYQLSLSAQSVSHDDAPGSLLGGKAAAELVARYEQGNQRIAHDYFGRDDGLFPPVDATEPTYDPGITPSQEDLIRLFTEAFSYQGNLIRALRDQNKALEKRIKRLESVNRNALTLKVERKLRGRDRLENN